MKDSEAERYWECADFQFDLSLRGEIMGILNVTPDSFSDGGKFNLFQDAVSHAVRMIDQGAAIIDVGGESTRPGAGEVPAVQEIDRTIPVVEELARRFSDVCLSIDTSKAEVGRAAIQAGARILNDVTGFRDREMIELAAETGVGVVVMHMQGTPRTMQANPAYDDVVESVNAFFGDRFMALTEAGVSPDCIVFDPGIGFGKSLDHNLELLRSVERLGAAGRPLLLGVSRKSFIGKVLASDDLSQRSWPTIAITAWTRERGVPLHRVHEVGPNLDAIRMIEAMLG